VFGERFDSSARQEAVATITCGAVYQPGLFYRRELPYLPAVLEQVTT
jgi:hypothetical protein